MNCPPDIANILLKILSQGTIRIRCFAGAGQPRRCFLEADHLHNLPSIIEDYLPARLRYYWDLERTSFMRQVPEAERRDLEPLWERLGELIEQHGIPPLELPRRHDEEALTR